MDKLLTASAAAVRRRSHDLRTFLSKYAEAHTGDLCAVVLLTLFSLFLCLLTFKPGYYAGHDTPFHNLQVRAVYESMLNGDFMGYIAPSIQNNFGASVRMFYSSFSHTFTAFLGVLIAPFGLTLTTAFKLTNFLSYLLTGIFGYRLGLAVFKGRFGYALVLAFILMANPYKVSDVYVRQAYAENFAATFLPLFFLALYRMLEEREGSTTPGPYIELAVSFSLLLLSHYATALFAAFFAVIYLFFKYPKLFRRFKDPVFYPYALGAVLTIVLIFLPKFVPLLVQDTADVNLRLYMNVQHTDYESIVNEIQYAGTFFGVGINFDAFIPGALILVGGAAAAALVRRLLPWKERSQKLLTAGILALALISVSVFLGVRFDAPLYALILTIIGLGAIALAPLIQTEKAVRLDWMEILAWIVLSALSLDLIFDPTLWKFFPEFFYKIQFPWRLWMFAVMFIGVAALSLYSKVADRLTDFRLLFPAAVCSFVLMPRVLDYWITYDYGLHNKVETFPYDDPASTGWQREYLNDYFIDTWLPNADPLYYKMRAWILYRQYDDYEFVPELSGPGAVENYVYSAERGATFTISGSEDGVKVVMPLFYFEGYEARLVLADGQSRPLEVYQSSGLVAFEAADGQISVRFVGTSAMRYALGAAKVAVPIFGLALFVYGAQYLPLKKFRDKSARKIGLKA